MQRPSAEAREGEKERHDNDEAKISALPFCLRPVIAVTHPPHNVYLPSSDISPCPLPDKWPGKSHLISGYNFFTLKMENIKTYLTGPSCPNKSMPSYLLAVKYRMAYVEHYGELFSLRHCSENLEICVPLRTLQIIMTKNGFKKEFFKGTNMMLGIWVRWDVHLWGNVVYRESWERFHRNCGIWAKAFNVWRSTQGMRRILESTVHWCQHQWETFDSIYKKECQLLTLFPPGNLMVK